MSAGQQCVDASDNFNKVADAASSICRSSSPARVDTCYCQQPIMNAMVEFQDTCMTPGTFVFNVGLREFTDPVSLQSFCLSANGVSLTLGDTPATTAPVPIATTASSSAAISSSSSVQSISSTSLSSAASQRSSSPSGTVSLPKQTQTSLTSPNSTIVSSNSGNPGSDSGISFGVLFVSIAGAIVGLLSLVALVAYLMRKSRNGQKPAKLKTASANADAAVSSVPSVVIVPDGRTEVSYTPIMEGPASSEKVSQWRANQGYH
ncbi:hypothetical protein BJ741DRAFT_615746 [Chytriomyces cf. hyalinus JEL632]|nr:hypothetical protein BJ741DRAFT_615746 [Chytriomyces cf. hyalinus JEL632]